MREVPLYHECSRANFYPWSPFPLEAGPFRIRSSPPPPPLFCSWGATHVKSLRSSCTGLYPVLSHSGHPTRGCIPRSAGLHPSGTRIPAPILFDHHACLPQLEGRHKAACKREFKLPWCNAGPPNHLDDPVHLDQWLVNKELSLSLRGGASLRETIGYCTDQPCPPIILHLLKCFWPEIRPRLTDLWGNCPAMSMEWANGRDGRM